MADRRSRHWAHDTFSSLTGGIGIVQARDMLVNWRATFGVPFRPMTAVRILLDVQVQSRNTIDINGVVTWGVLIAPFT